MNDAKQIIARIQQRPSNVCANCRHPETVDAIRSDGDVITLFCPNVRAYVRSLTWCDGWEVKP